MDFSSTTFLLPKLMDFSSTTILLTFLTLLATLFIVTTRSKRESSKLPPGPRKLPLIGNLHLFATSLAPHRVLANVASKYGSLVHLKLGEVSTIVISSPELAKEILKSHDITFANRPLLFTPEIVGYNHTGVGFSPYGEHWRQLRKICSLELFSAKRVQSFRPLREEEFTDMCRGIASRQGSAINLTEILGLTMCNNLARAAVGNKTKEQATLVSTIKASTSLNAGFSIIDLYPSVKLLRLLGGFGLKAKLERIRKKNDKIFDNIINEHKMAKAEGNQQEDLVDVLLKFNDPTHEPYLTWDHMKAVIMDMFIGGIDTSSATLDWCMVELLRHPEILKKVQDEVKHVYGDMGFVDESRTDKLQYMKLVIKEVLRMHPPVPLLIPRENYKTCEINGYKIHPKTRVMVNTWVIGRDPRYWKDADSFIPERYLDNGFDYKGTYLEYIPFSAGRRICPGIIFALASMELPLAMLLYHFDWVLPDGMKPENLDMTESFGSTTRRERPLHVIPVVKNPLPLKGTA